MQEVPPLTRTFSVLNTPRNASLNTTSGLIADASAKVGQLQDANSVEFR
jgi:hypothetical protein